jgi:hypothetical protein
MGETGDAFEECIKDFQWRPAKGYVILHDHFEVFAAYAAAEFKVALTIFGSAIKYWQEKNRITFYVLLRDNVCREFELRIVNRLKDDIAFFRFPCYHTISITASAILLAK